MIPEASWGWVSSPRSHSCLVCMRAHTQPRWLPPQVRQHGAPASWRESRPETRRDSRGSRGRWGRPPVRLRVSGVIPVPSEAPRRGDFLFRGSNSHSPWIESHHLGFCVKLLSRRGPRGTQGGAHLATVAQRAWCVCGQASGGRCSHSCFSSFSHFPQTLVLSVVLSPQRN